jgi:hypothetical protein
MRTAVESHKGVASVTKFSTTVHDIVSKLFDPNTTIALACIRLHSLCLLLVPQFPYSTVREGVPLHNQRPDAAVGAAAPPRHANPTVVEPSRGRHCYQVPIR